MSPVDVPLPRLAISAALVAIAIAAAAWQRTGIAKRLAWATVRGTAQLFLVGYGLELLLARDRPLATACVVAAMLVVAAWTASRRIDRGPPPSRLFAAALASIALGGAVALVPVFALVVVPPPGEAARFVVPIAGIVLSNAMNTVALVFDRIFASAREAAPTIEQLLALGASPEQATRAQTRAALRGAFVPTVNGLLTIGLVSLPGMMTGQIVAGAPPDRAIRYQLVIVYQLAAVAAVSGIAAATLARRMLFTTGEILAPPPPDARPPRA